MRHRICSLILVLLGWAVGVSGAYASETAGAADAAAPASEILIPGEPSADSIRSIATSPAPGGQPSRQAIFLCHTRDRERLCGVLLFEDELSPVAEGGPLFPGMLCSIDGSMAWSPGQKLAITAACRQAGQAGVWLQATDRAGKRLGAPSLVAPDDLLAPTAPLVVSAGDESFWVFWLRGCPDRCRLMGRRYSWNITPIGESIALTAPGNAAFQTRPAVCALPGGDVVVAWEHVEEQDRGSVRRIALLRLDEEGKVVARTSLPNRDPSASDRAPVMAATADGCVVAWQRTWPRSNVPPTVLVQRLGKDLSASGPPIDLHDLRPEAYAIGSPAIAPRGRDLLVAWRETPARGALADLVVGRLSTDGAWIGEPFRVARSLPHDWPRIWLKPTSGDRWALFWRQPPDDAELPHPWLRRLLVPWQGELWNTGAAKGVSEAAPGDDTVP